MSPFRLSLRNTVSDSHGAVLLSRLQKNGFTALSKVSVHQIYTIEKDFSDEKIDIIGNILANPICEEFALNTPLCEENFSWVIEIGFLPGVTDNVAKTVTKIIEDRFNVRFVEPEEMVYTAKHFFVWGDISSEMIEQIAGELHNDMVEYARIKDGKKFLHDGGMDLIVPKVTLQSKPEVSLVDLEIADEALIELGKKGIPNSDGTRRGPLALGLPYLQAIRDYYRNIGRKPTDIELESLAQTWSEHCKHTIFADPLDDISEGIYRYYIKRATQEIRAQKADKDFCVSVFSDNSGAIVFDDEYLITDKVETHNSPSALGPFGGAITGIVGVNRDTLGFGKAAKPIINRYGFCLGLPEDETVYYRDAAHKQKTLKARTVMDGVIAGVNAGGNESGIPSPIGFITFDSRFISKPLVFAGTIGLIPKLIQGKPSWEKSAQDGDLILVIGGRVGRDGIHGATFSSEAIDDGSPATAVQIGDPITQKKLSDLIIREARDAGLFHSITDNGAGGISCSVAEMARECGGCMVDLEKVPLKYPNLQPWEIWISESQERMTLAVPKDKKEAFERLLQKREVEYAFIGTFTSEKRCRVSFHGELIFDLEMEFLHNGLPKIPQKTQEIKKHLKEPQLELRNTKILLLEMLKRHNISSAAFVSEQYDHTVQSGACLGPLQGRGKVNVSATVNCPLLGSPRGVISSFGLLPRYSDIDTYAMTAASIDTAIRNAVSVGANIDYLAILDNFCWCSSDEPTRLFELKRAAQACYDVAIGFGTPYISGKDSMFNDFRGFDHAGNPISISIPPTVLISALGVIDDVDTTMTIDPKISGDFVYIIGETFDELGGSEFYDSFGYIGKNVPQVDVQKAYDRYQRIYQASQNHLIASCASVDIGGIAVTCAKKCIASGFGMKIDLQSYEKKSELPLWKLLFSETQSRFVVTIDTHNQEVFTQLFPEAVLIGSVTQDAHLEIRSVTDHFQYTIEELAHHYQIRFADN